LKFIFSSLFIEIATMQNLTKLLLSALLMILTLNVSAQKKSKSNNAEVVVPKLIDAKNFQSLKWRNIGPFRGGRANGISGVPGNNQLYFVGYTGGGVWKTQDAGLNWVNISDGFFTSSTIGDIAVAESDPNVIYVGTGEHAVRGVMTTFGDGVYKSTDQGKTWKNMGLENTRHISDVIIHPQNPDIVWVAAQGALHGPSEERGVYKTTDGGVTWKKTLYVDVNSGVSSLTVDFSNPRIMYAATWDHRRLPWQVQSGGNGCSVWKSTDGGESWSEGSKSESLFMSQVPAGTYHINLYPEWGSINKDQNNFEIWVYEDVPMWSNFWVTLIVAALVVIIYYIRFRIFESNRWMESNFDSPYVTQYE
jgi:photosystem II stability/assembly factor-like uncharacterized protein